MKYVFVITDFSTELYFCDYTDKGFKLTTRIEDALSVPDPESANKETERLKRESGYAVQTRKVRMTFRVHY